MLLLLLLHHLLVMLLLLHHLLLLLLLLLMLLLHELLLRGGLLLVLAISLLDLPSKLGSKAVKPTVGMRQVCTPGQGDSASDLQALRRPVLRFLRTLPRWSSLTQTRETCGSGFRSLDDQQQRTVRCVVAVNREVPKLSRSGKAGFDKLRSCASNLCQSAISGLGHYCSQLGR